MLITLSIIAIYLTGVPWLAYLAGWEVAYIWGIKFCFSRNIQNYHSCSNNGKIT